MAIAERGVLAPSVFKPKSGPANIAALEPSLTINAGSTTHFSVSYDSSLGAQGAADANSVLARCEADYNSMEYYFSGITPGSLPFNIGINPGSGGASHATCASTGMSVGANSGPATDTAFINLLVVAEEDEVFMADFGHGWNCVASNGEGLSRVLANALYPNDTPADFVAAPTWLTSARPDWVSNTENTDQDYTSIGCSVLFLNWLRYQLGCSWPQIISAGATTEAQLFQNLTGLTDAFGRFSALMEALFPTGSGILPSSDNPFPIPTYTLVSRATGKVIDLPAFEVGDQVILQQFHSNGGSNQHWMFLPVAGSPAIPQFNIISPISGKVFDIPAGNPADGIKLQQFRRDGGANQAWNLVPVIGGYYKIVNVATNKVLDVAAGNPADGIQIQQFRDNGGTNQQWKLVPVSLVCTITSAGTGKVLDDPAFSRDNQTIIQQFSPNGGINQQWHILLADAANNLYNIISRWSGKVLDVPGGATADQVQIQQFQENGGANQKWGLIVADLPTGKYRIRSQASGKVLDIPDNSNADGVKLQQFTDHNGPNQQWTFAPVYRPA